MGVLRLLHVTIFEIQMTESSNQLFMMKRLHFNLFQLKHSNFSTENHGKENRDIVNIDIEREK